MFKKRLKLEAYIAGVLAGNRVILSQCITLIESQLADDKKMAKQVLEAILPHTGHAIRIGITGVPGVGKSTFIEAFGKEIIAANKTLAILAIDPSSQKTGGSIMGDKTRMEVLSHHPAAYIRPTPTGMALGGVANKTRETMLLCEAAGFEVIIIETVGVGQSETIVKGMVDFFLLLMLAGAGDELQGIKRGIMEMADAIVITKADGANVQNARNARVEYTNALHLFPASNKYWAPEVLTCSALEGNGIAEIWDMINIYATRMGTNGFWLSNRQKQNLDWMYAFIRQTLEDDFFENSSVKAKRMSIEKQVIAGELLALQGALALLENRSTKGQA